MKTQKITKIIWTIAILLLGVAGVLVLVKTHANYMNKYAIEHNCVWKYNGMCYSVDSWEAKHLA